MVFYCDHGKRAFMACSMARHLGFEHAQYYPGGIREWVTLHPEHITKFLERSEVAEAK